MVLAVKIFGTNGKLLNLGVPILKHIKAILFL